MKYILRLSFLLAGILFFPNLKASHLIGGEMTYRCLGNDQYEITLEIYRDCTNGSAPFDEEIALFIRKEGYTSDVLLQGSLDSVMVGLGEVKSIGGIIDPCMEIPYDYCEEKGIYKTIITLPNTGDAYHILHQRCCRPADLLNLSDPAEQGNTYFVTIYTSAMNLCNSSPSFYQKRPLTVICANLESELNFYCTDSDGDSVAYEIHHPYAGGSFMNTMPGITQGPFPGIPSELLNVVYTPGFNAQNPFGANTSVSIDKDGQLSIQPGEELMIGKYVVSVLVKEYRDGVLLSTVYRDHVITTTDCVGERIDIEAEAVTTELCKGEEGTLVVRNSKPTNKYYVRDAFSFLSVSSTVQGNGSDLLIGVGELNSTQFFQVLVYDSTEICHSNISSPIAIEVKGPKNDWDISGFPTVACEGESRAIQIGASEEGVAYYVVDAQSDEVVSDTVMGTDSSLIISIPTFLGEQTYKVGRYDTLVGCEAELSEEITLQVRQTDSIKVGLIENIAICAGAEITLELSSISGGYEGEGWIYRWMENDSLLSSADTLVLSPNESKEIVLEIADNCSSVPGRDTVFVEVSSNKSIELTNISSMTGVDSLAIEGCSKVELVVERDGDLSSSELVRIETEGTATEGVDYESIEDVSFGVGMSKVLLEIDVFADELDEEDEWLKVVLSPIHACRLEDMDTLWIQNVDPIQVAFTEDTLVVQLGENEVEVQASGGYGSLSYQWNGQDWEQDSGSKVMNFTEDSLVTVQVKDICNTPGTTSDSIQVIVGPTGELVANKYLGVIYPNPSNGVIQFNPAQELIGESVLLQIVDATGRIVLSEEKTIEVGQQLDCSGFPAGIYKMVVSGQFGVGQNTLIIQ